MDKTESIRREMIANAVPTAREQLEATHGQVWDTDELQQDFTVSGFMAPFLGVTRKSDGVRGSMRFQARPRFYFGFRPSG